MQALLKLVSHEASGKSVSLAKEFDLVLEENGASKSFSLYAERRFSKLGYTAGAILNCVEYFNIILDQTHLDNTLVKACKIYLQCEYGLSEQVIL